MERVPNNSWAYGPFYFSKEATIRYHYEKPTEYSSIYGTTYNCDRPVYRECTLFKINENGLAIIQQRYNRRNKTAYWGRIDPWLIDELYLHKNFEMFFNERSGRRIDGIYQTVTIRQIMWGLKMKPLPRERWETCFDRKLI